MFIIIPLIFIFLAVAFLQINPTLSLVVKVLVYIFIFLVIAITMFITKKIKDDIKIQEINQTILAVKKLKKQLLNTTDKQKILGLKNEIEKLENEISIR